MVLRPASNKIIVRKKHEVYEGIIILADTVKGDPPVEGEVVAIGPAVQDTEPGDTVVYGKFTGWDIIDPELINEKKSKKDFALIAETDILMYKENA